MDLETNIFSSYPGQAGKDSCFTLNLDKLVNSPKFRHACEGRHPELLKNWFPAFAGRTPKDVLIIRRVSNFGILI